MLGRYNDGIYMLSSPVMFACFTYFNTFCVRPLGISDADVDTEKPEARCEADETFVHFIKLSEIVGEALRRLYSAKAKAMGYGKRENENVIDFLRGLLNDWRNNLPARLNITDDELASMRARFNEDVTQDKAYREKGIQYVLLIFGINILCLQCVQFTALQVLL
jgi:hypothetical protein